MTSGRSLSETSSFRLCFVDEGVWAYFANVPPTEVWGDDWNDAPHDRNAGLPYHKEGQEIVCVAFDGALEVVTERESYLSAEQLNKREAPWLVDPGYGDTYPKPRVEIWAGVTLAEFKNAVRAARGNVYTVED